jgi:hypothetical protein
MAIKITGKINQKPAIKGVKGTGIKATRFIPESTAGKFSRMGPPVLNPVARFYPNNQMVAVVYKSQGPFASEIFASYSLIYYDLKGNILPKKQGDLKKWSRGFTLAYSEIENSMTCTIDASGNISQTEYKNVWKKEVEKHGFEGNKLVDFKPSKTTTFKLDSKGKFERNQIRCHGFKGRAVSENG